MPFFRCKHIAITGIATAVPKNCVSIESFIPRFGEDGVRKFTAITGIKSFRRVHEKQTASDLGYSAADYLLSRKQIERDSIGALVFVSHLTDYRRPATACVLHNRLNLSKECAAYDINLGCSAYVYGLQTVASLMQCSDIHRALLVVAETVSRLVHSNDRSTAMLFGDAGSATLLEKNTEAPDIVGLLRTDGRGYRTIIVPAGGFRQLNAPSGATIWPDGNEKTLFNIHMNGPDVFNFAMSDVPRAFHDFFEYTETGVTDYDSCIMHQANKFIIMQLARKLKIPSEKCPISIDRYGNTSAAALPLTLCDAWAGLEPQVLRLLLAGFGVGLSWGIVSAFVSTANIYPVIESDDYFAEGIITTPEKM